MVLGLGFSVGMSGCTNFVRNMVSLDILEVSAVRVWMRWNTCSSVRGIGFNSYTRFPLPLTPLNLSSTMSCGHTLTRRWTTRARFGNMEPEYPSQYHPSLIIHPLSPLTMSQLFPLLPQPTKAPLYLTHHKLHLYSKTLNMQHSIHLSYLYLLTEVLYHPHLPTFQNHLLISLISQTRTIIHM